MDSIFQGIPEVICYSDDFLVTCKSEADHHHNLEAVLKQLQEYGIRLKREKCSFIQEAMEYLGHHVSVQGVRTSQMTLKTIMEALKSRNVQELHSFSGLVNYYSKFISKLSSVLHPLDSLLQVDRRWMCCSACTEAFREAKKKLRYVLVLVHFNSKLPLILAGDASACGVHGCSNFSSYARWHGESYCFCLQDFLICQMQFCSGCEGRPLRSAKCNFAQVVKEDLYSHIWHLQIASITLYCQNFTIITDHKPLTTMHSPRYGIPTLSAVVLSISDYCQHIPTSISFGQLSPMEMWMDCHVCHCKRSQIIHQR